MANLGRDVDLGLLEVERVGIWLGRYQHAKKEKHRESQLRSGMDDIKRVPG